MGSGRSSRPEAGIDGMNVDVMPEAPVNMAGPSH
jgi:hypothetical protein